MIVSISEVKKFKKSTTWAGFIKINKSIIDLEVKDISNRAKSISNPRKQQTYIKNNMQELNIKYTTIWSILNNKTKIFGKYWSE